jgi:hypothetical protein
MRILIWYLLVVMVIKTLYRVCLIIWPDDPSVPDSQRVLNIWKIVFSIPIIVLAILLL